MRQNIIKFINKDGKMTKNMYKDKNMIFEKKMYDETS